MATTAFSAQWGFVPPETAQTLAVADGWKTFIPYEVDVDTDSIDGGFGILTIPATGIYHLDGTFYHQNPSSTSGGCFSRWLADGVDVLAEGDNPNSTGTDQGTPVAQFVGCLEAGTTLEFQARMGGGSAADYTSGTISVLRVPDPFTILEKDATYTPSHDAFEEYQPICDIPAWFDPGLPTRVTVPEAGYYLLAHKNVQSQSPDGGNNWRVSWVYVNGTFANMQIGYPGSLTNYPLNAVLSLGAGDYVEIFNDNQTGTNPLNEIDLAMFKFPGTFCGAHIYLHNQDVYGTFDPVLFDTFIYDTDGFWAGGTDPYLTVPSGKAGVYLIWTTDIKGGLRHVRSYLDSSNAGVPLSWDGVISGVDNYNIGNYASSPHFQIRDLAVGDQVSLLVQNNDSGGTAYQFNMGMALIDGWSYTDQAGCPCPTGFMPQIYRWLKK